MINQPQLLQLDGVNPYEPLLAWPWLFPIGTLLTLIIATKGNHHNEPNQTNR